VSCMFRVSGEYLDIEELVKAITLEPNRVWRKGEPRSESKPDSRILSKSGASFIASSADMDEFEIQLKEATDFIKNNIIQIQKIVGFNGVSEAVFDFGVELRDVAIHCDYLSPEFVRYAAEAGIGVEISHYPCVEE
jgi:hypothetical protein